MHSGLVMQHLFPAKLLLRILFQGLFGPLHTEAMSFGFSRAKDQEILANRSFNKVLSTFIARDKALKEQDPRKATSVCRGSSKSAELEPTFKRRREDIWNHMMPERRLPCGSCICLKWGLAVSISGIYFEDFCNSHKRHVFRHHGIANTIILRPCCRLME